jgi:hypothetical protein
MRLEVPGGRGNPLELDIKTKKNAVQLLSFFKVTNARL